jgi:hypothetical protein
VTDDYPANDFEATAYKFQWFFDLKEIQERFGQRVSARFAESAMRDLTAASFGDNANEVRLAWQLLLDSIGPILTGLFISTGAWKKFCPEPDHDVGAPAMAILWRKNGKQVVGRVTFKDDRAHGIRFDVE